MWISGHWDAQCTKCTREVYCSKPHTTMCTWPSCTTTWPTPRPTPSRCTCPGTPPTTISPPSSTMSTPGVVTSTHLTLSMTPPVTTTIYMSSSTGSTSRISVPLFIIPLSIHHLFKYFYYLILFRMLLRIKISMISLGFAYRQILEEDHLLITV